MFGTQVMPIAVLEIHSNMKRIQVLIPLIKIKK